MCLIWTVFVIWTLGRRWLHLLKEFIDMIYNRVKGNSGGVVRKRRGDRILRGRKAEAGRSAPPARLGARGRPLAAARARSALPPRWRSGSDGVAPSLPLGLGSR